MEIKKNIVLLGMMGSGKSTIGGLLAKKLNSVLIDIDKKIMNKELRKVLKQKSSTFWLHWNADTLIKRIKNNDKRPIIKGLDDFEIKKLINERNKIYYFSDFKIICESLKKTEIVDKIIKKCKKNEIIC